MLNLVNVNLNIKNQSTKYKCLSIHDTNKSLSNNICCRFNMDSVIDLASSVFALVKPFRIFHQQP